MHLKQLLNADDTVSPVTGAILMVAITIILAAVIGTFVLGLSDQVQENPPSAQGDWEGDTSRVELTHVSGEASDPARVEVTDSVNNDGPFCDSGSEWDGGVSSITAGTTCTITSGLDADEELRLVWTADGGESSSTLTQYTVRS